MYVVREDKEADGGGGGGGGGGDAEDRVKWKSMVCCGDP